MLYAELVSVSDANGAKNVRRGLSGSESRLLASFSAKGRTIFRLKDVSAELDRSYGYAKVLVNNLTKKRWITRLRRGTYLIVPLAAGIRSDYTEHEFVIASHLVVRYPVETQILRIRSGVYRVDQNQRLRPGEEPRRRAGPSRESGTVYARRFPPYDAWMRSTDAEEPRAAAQLWSYRFYRFPPAAGEDPRRGGIRRRGVRRRLPRDAWPQVLVAVRRWSSAHRRLEAATLSGS